MRTKPSSISAFTLIEIITAMAIILVLTGLVIQISGYVTNRGSRARAQGELAMLATACESYKADSGGYPMDIQTGAATPGVTDKLKPKEHFNPTAAVYEEANLFLYKELTGDKKECRMASPRRTNPDTSRSSIPKSSKRIATATSRSPR